MTSKKVLAMKLYRIINAFPFNNRRRGKVHILNNGAVLLKCRIQSTGNGNKLILRGGYSATVNLCLLETIM